MEKRKVDARNHDGTTSTVTSKVSVQDFKMSFDLTPYISPSGTITTLPSPTTGRSPTLREVMEAHVEEDNPFKELHMEKVYTTYTWREHGGGGGGEKKDLGTKLAC